MKKRYYSKSGVIFTYENNAAHFFKRSKRANRPHFYCNSLQFSEEVRMDDRLSNNERILLADIIDLVKQKGYCYATNQYLAQIHHVSTRTITRWLKKLRELLYITIEIIKTDKKEIVERRIRIIDEFEKQGISKNGIICTRSSKNNPYRQNCRKNTNYIPVTENNKISNTQIPAILDTKKPFVTDDKDFEWLNGKGFDPLR